MEKRIKTLYTVTIIAIIAFLGMQIYWLYNRYEFSLKEYERNLSERIGKYRAQNEACKVGDGGVG